MNGLKRMLTYEQQEDRKASMILLYIYYQYFDINHECLCALVLRSSVSKCVRAMTPGYSSQCGLLSIHNTRQENHSCEWTPLIQAAAD